MRGTCRRIRMRTYTRSWLMRTYQLPNWEGSQSVSYPASQYSSDNNKRTTHATHQPKKECNAQYYSDEVVPPAPPHRSMAVMTDKVSLRWFCDAVLIMRSTMQPLFLWIYHSYDSSRFHNEDYLLLWLNVVGRCQVASSTCISIRIGIVSYNDLPD